MKRNIKKYVSVSMALFMVLGNFGMAQNVNAAKKVSLPKTAKVTEGKTKVIKLANNSSKIIWKVVKGTKNVKLTKKSNAGCTVKGLKAGKATIQANAAKKSYKCVVTVTAKKTEPTVKPKETKEPQSTIKPEETREPQPTIKPEETREPQQTNTPEETKEPDDTPVSKVIEYDGTNKSEVDGCKEKFHLIVKDGVEAIPISEFENCTNLAEVTIPSSVTSIGYGAFYGCSSLKSITIPDSVEYIGVGAFENCRKLEKIYIGKGARSIELIGYVWDTTIDDEIRYDTFKGCDNLKEIVVDEDNIYYDSRNNCNAIIETSSNKLIAGCKNTVIPEGVESIGSIGTPAFENCSGLKSINIPSSVTDINETAFAYCTSLSKIIVDKNNKVYSSGDNSNAILSKTGKTLYVGCKNTKIPDTVRIINDGAFMGSDGIKEIPGTVKIIGEYAFRGCDGLTEIKISEGVEEIGSEAFLECSNLTKVTLPESLTSICYYSFAKCSKLKNITIPVNVTEMDEFIDRNKDTMSITYKGKTYSSYNEFNKVFFADNNL